MATRLFCEQRPSIPKRLGLFGLPRRGSAGPRDQGGRKRSIENRERALCVATGRRAAKGNEDEQDSGYASRRIRSRERCLDGGELCVEKPETS